MLECNNFQVSYVGGTVLLNPDRHGGHTFGDRSGAEQR